jgi:2-keto-4-pentenoate hydratase/2-oxohepta-3-ene-1,7-dioic acid hydratase in catechol pathway
MILLSIETQKGPKLAVKLAAGVVIYEELPLQPSSPPRIPRSIDEALSTPDALDELRRWTMTTLDSHDGVHPFLRSERELNVGLPFRPRNVICVGLNYRSHAEEGGRELPKEPVLFAKWTNSLIGIGQPIVLNGDSQEVDYEAELAVVIGRRCRRVSASEALNYVAGYTCLNDVSARDFQRNDKQWVRAKSQDTFGPMGPYLVTREEVPDPQNLAIRCYLNGAIVQDSNTKEMIFPVRDLISFASRGMTLEPGDVISTGTPHGVGFARKPPVFLKNGDEVVVEIEKVGRLHNPVLARSSRNLG